MLWRKRDEGGLAMIMTVIVIAVAASLIAVVLYQATSTERHSGRGKNWNEALQAADGGIEEAIARLQSDQGVVPVGDIVGNTADGTYLVKVKALGRNRYQMDSWGTAGHVQGLKSERHIRVIMAPPHSFKYALFSLTDLATKNNNLVNGDVWANGSVTVNLGDSIIGSVNAATGFLTMENGSYIEGDVETGGYNSSGNSMDVYKIKGNVKASSTSPNCVDDPGHGKYGIVNGEISGNASTWGTSVSSSVGGTTVTKKCTLAPATKPIPTFNFNPLNYDPSPKTYASVADFQSYLSAFGSNFSGVHYVNGPGIIDLTGVTVTGDATIIASEAQIWTNGVEASGSNDKLFVLVSFYNAPAGATCTDNGGNPDQCAIGIKNNFQPDENIATLVYAPNGPVAFKNSAEFVGAAYGANLVMKNNMEVTYDARIDQIVGFGPVTLIRDSWVELPK